MRHYSSPRHSHARKTAGWAIVLLLAGMPRSVWAQEADAPTITQKGGPQLHSVSAYFDYYSAALPNGGGFQYSTKLLSDAAIGGSAQVGWAKSIGRTVSSFSYTSTFIGRLRYSQSNAWNHAFSLTTSRKLAPRWSFGVSASGDLSSQEQSAFAPTTLSNVAAAQSTFDDLASAFLASKFTNNPQLASILTSAPLADSPVRNLLYGQRMFTSAVQTSISYSYSPRFSVFFQAGAGRNQHLSENLRGAGQNSYVIPNTTSGSAGLTISYSLSPKTQIGASVITTRIFSSQQDAYTTTSLATLGRTFARRWIVQMHGGVGFINPVRRTSFLNSTKPHPAGGGSLIFKTFEHALLATYDRSVSDTYGVGAASTSSAAFTWRWSRPGRSWWLESSVGFQQLQGGSSGNTSGWRTTAGLGRAIGNHVTLSTQYSYLNYSGQIQRIPYTQDQNAVRVSVTWTPRPEFLR